MTLRNFCQLTFCADWRKAIILSHDLILAMNCPSKMYVLS